LSELFSFCRHRPQTGPSRPPRLGPPSPLTVSGISCAVGLEQPHLVADVLEDDVVLAVHEDHAPRRDQQKVIFLGGGWTCVIHKMDAPWWEGVSKKLEVAVGGGSSMVACTTILLSQQSLPSPDALHS
jgi:hypothetical protein